MQGKYITRHTDWMIPIAFLAGLWRHIHGFRSCSEKSSTGVCESACSTVSSSQMVPHTPGGGCSGHSVVLPRLTSGSSSSSSSSGQSDAAGPSSSPGGATRGKELPSDSAQLSASSWCADTLSEPGGMLPVQSEGWEDVLRPERRVCPRPVLFVMRRHDPCVNRDM